MREVEEEKECRGKVNEVGEKGRRENSERKIQREN